MRHIISSLHRPLNRLPHVSPNNAGHLELKNSSTHGEAGCKLYCSMYNTRYMSHVNYIELVQIKLLSFCFYFVNFFMRRFASHIFNTFNKKWRQVKPRRRQENGQTWYFSKLPYLRHILEKSTHSLFGAQSFFLGHIQFLPSEGPKSFVNLFFKIFGPSSWTPERPSSIVWLHSPWCKPALRLLNNQFEYFKWDQLDIVDFASKNK